MMNLDLLIALNKGSLMPKRLRAAIQKILDDPTHRIRRSAIERLISIGNTIKRLGFDLTDFEKFIDAGVREWVDDDRSITQLADMVRNLRVTSLPSDYAEERFLSELKRLDFERTDVETLLTLYRPMRGRTEDDRSIIPVDMGFLGKMEAQEWLPVVEDLYENNALGEPWENFDDLRVLARYPKAAYWYAVEIMEGNTGDTAQIIKDSIAKDAVLAARYADALRSDGRRWKVGGNVEKRIAASAEASVIYAETYGKRFRLGEAAIEADPYWKDVYQTMIRNRDISPTEYIRED